MGQIDITSGVSPTGARTYTVPISAYKGIRGFNPELSFVYNSQQGNGLLGMGWSLSGLSVICRTVQTPYYDGKIAPIAFNREDVFMLDGMRLVKVDSVTYLSERGYIRVKANYAGNSLQYFDVAFPNGRTAIFGYKTNTNNNLYYPLTELSDLWGNTITYHYISQGNHYRINKTFWRRCPYITFTDERMGVITCCLISLTIVEMQGRKAFHTTQILNFFQ